MTIEPWHTANAPFGFTNHEKSAWSVGCREGYALAAQGTPPADASAVPAVRVPEGFCLVPIEPTEAMVDAACDIDARAEVIARNKELYPQAESGASAGEVFRIQWREALAAAPAGGAVPPEPSEAEWAEIERETAELMAMTAEEIDAELRSMGFDPEIVEARARTAVNRAIARAAVQRNPHAFSCQHAESGNRCAKWCGNIDTCAVAMLSAPPAQEPVAWQYLEDGKWHTCSKARADWEARESDAEIRALAVIEKGVTK